MQKRKLGNSGLELITHLAFYSVWPNAMSAIIVAKEVFSKA
jgi:alkylhydroperoxidase/carboxymuconolactone decarboxylase family protein YurZ